MGVLVEEEYLDRHFRALKIDCDKKRLYSIDVYLLLPKSARLNCYYTLEAGGPARMCYVRLGLCEGVVVIAGDRAEIVNLRLLADKASDPAGGDIRVAARLCMNELSTYTGRTGEILGPGEAHKD